MTRDSTFDRAEAVVAEAPPAAAPPAKKTAAASIEVLSSDEVIQLSIRPSPWSIALRCLKLVLVLLLVGTALLITAQGRPTLLVSIGLLAVVLAAFGAVVAATLQWASQLYVLTNKRVMCFRGVFVVSRCEAELAHLDRPSVEPSWHRELLRVGTLRIPRIAGGHVALRWEHIARPDEICEIVERAIGRAHSS